MMRLTALSIALFSVAASLFSGDEKWIKLFNGKDLAGWTATGKASAFSVQDGSLYCDGSGGRLIYYAPQQFDNFVLKMQVKVSEKANSGIFFRMTDPKDVLSGIEMQVLDSYGRPTVDTHDFGAIYDIQAPSKNAAKPAGEWNHVTITCNGPKVQVELNGERVVNIDLNRWTEPGLNPDGTKNKYKTAYKQMTKKGYMALQDHGKPIWFRNIKVKPL